VHRIHDKLSEKSPVEPGPTFLKLLRKIFGRFLNLGKSSENI